MLTSVAFLCLNFAFAFCSAGVQASLERNTVPLVPPPRAASKSQSEELHEETVREPFAPSAALELNPLAVAFGKCGGNVEIALAPHQVLLLSPAYFDYGNYFHGPEAELGYRFYFFPHTLSGPFLGAGIMGAAFLYHPDASCGVGIASCSREDQATYLYGATLETGWQWVLHSHVVRSVGAGLIVQHSAPRKRELYDSDFTNIAELVLGSGVHPRGLFAVGYAL